MESPAHSESEKAQCIKSEGGREQWVLKMVQNWEDNWNTEMLLNFKDFSTFSWQCEKINTF